MKPALRHAGDAGKHVSQPSQSIDAIEFRRNDECGYGSGPLGAAFKTSEEP